MNTPNKVEHVAFDSNVLTYFLEGNKGDYSLSPSDPLAEHRIATVRLFLWCSTPYIMPTVTAEAKRISGNPAKLEEHLSAISGHFGEFTPDEEQDDDIVARAAKLLPYHPSRENGANDCRILAEVEECGDIRVLVTLDKQFKALAGSTHVRIQTPVECWSSLGIPRGTPPVWTPADGHPLAAETWWHW